MDANVKTVIAMGVLCGLLSGAWAGKPPTIPRPHWVIVATLMDRATGELLEQGPIVGRGMQFRSSGQCMRILHQVEPAENGYVAVVLTCERVGPPEVDL